MFQKVCTQFTFSVSLNTPFSKELPILYDTFANKVELKSFSLLKDEKCDERWELLLSLRVNRTNIYYIQERRGKIMFSINSGYLTNPHISYFEIIMN